MPKRTFNMIRNWTGESTEEVFYQLCDEYGMLVFNARIFHNAGHAHALFHVLSVYVIKHRLSVGNR